MVGGAVALFAVTAGVVAELALRARFDAGETFATAGSAALRAISAHSADPDFWGPDRTLSNPVPDPGSTWPALLGHVAALSLVMAAALLVVTALVVRNRAGAAGWIAVLGAGLVVTAGGGAGPLGVLAPELPTDAAAQSLSGRGDAAQQQRWQTYYDTTFDPASPLWLRAAAAAFVLLLLVGAAVLLRRRLAAAPTAPGPLDRGGAAVAVGYGGLAGAVLLLAAPPLADSGGAGLLSVPTVVAGLLLAGTGAAAGQALASRTAAAALTGAVAAAGVAVWLAAGRGPAQPAFGFGEWGEAGPTVGNLALLLVLAASVPAGHLAGAALRAVSRSRAPGPAVPLRRSRPAAS